MVVVPALESRWKFSACMFMIRTTAKLLGLVALSLQTGLLTRTRCLRLCVAVLFDFYFAEFAIRMSILHVQIWDHKQERLNLKSFNFVRYALLVF